MFGIYTKVIGYPLQLSLFFSIIFLLLSSCSTGNERADNKAVDQSVQIPVDSNSDVTTTQNDSFLWNGIFKFNGIEPSKQLDTNSLDSQRFDMDRNSCRVYISLHKYDIDEAAIYLHAIERAEACPLCWLDSVYDIHVQNRKGIGTRSLFTDIRQPGTWSMTNNVIWFNKSETTFNKFARIQFDCSVGRMEFVNINNLE